MVSILPRNNLVGGAFISLSLFYRYYNGRCSKGLSLVVPPKRTFGRTTRFSAHSHPCTVSVSKANTWWYSSSFFPRTALLWNSLPVSCFPATYNLSQFKRNINSHDKLLPPGILTKVAAPLETCGKTTAIILVQLYLS